MKHRRRAIVIAAIFSIFVFVSISVLLALGLSGSGVERARVLEVLKAQAAGDFNRVLELLPACAAQPACAGVTRDRVAELKRPGKVEILNYVPSTRLSLTRRTAVARVAWRAGTDRATVQCVNVRREGPLTGGNLKLLAISAPIGRESGC